jgi:hypothetical protein
LHLDLEHYPPDRGWPSSLTKLDSVLAINADETSTQHPTDAVRLHVWDTKTLIAEPSGLPDLGRRAYHLLYAPDQRAVDTLAAYLSTWESEPSDPGRTPHPLQGLHRVLTSSEDLGRAVQALDVRCPVDLAIETVDSDRVLQIHPPPEDSAPALIIPWEAWPLAAEVKVDTALRQLRAQHPSLRILAFVETETDRRTFEAPLPAPLDDWVLADQVPALAAQARLVALLWQSPTGNSHHLWGRWALQGIPCVCRNESDVRAWVTQGETGLLVDPLPDKWTMAVNMLLLNSKLRGDITDRAQEFAYFNLNLWKKSKQVFQQLIEGTDAYAFPHFYPL